MSHGVEVHTVTIPELQGRTISWSIYGSHRGLGNRATTRNRTQLEQAEGGGSNANTVGDGMDSGPDNGWGSHGRLDPNVGRRKRPPVFVCPSANPSMFLSLCSVSFYLHLTYLSIFVSLSLFLFLSCFLFLSLSLSAHSLSLSRSSPSLCHLCPPISPYSSCLSPFLSRFPPFFLPPVLVCPFSAALHSLPTLSLVSLRSLTALYQMCCRSLASLRPSLLSFFTDGVAVPSLTPKGKMKVLEPTNVFANQTRLTAKQDPGNRT